MNYEAVYRTASATPDLLIRFDKYTEVNYLGSGDTGISEMPERDMAKSCLVVLQCPLHIQGLQRALRTPSVSLTLETFSLLLQDC